MHHRFDLPPSRAGHWPAPARSFFPADVAADAPYASPARATAPAHSWRRALRRMLSRVLDGEPRRVPAERSRSGQSSVPSRVGPATEAAVARYGWAM